MSIVYLAHPIDHADPVNRERMQHTINRLQMSLASLGAGGVFTASGAWFCSQPFDHRVQDINEKILSECDGMLVYLPVGVPSIGVPMEIALVRHRKPCVIVRGSGDYQVEWDSLVLSSVAQDIPMYTEDDLEVAVRHLLTAIEILQRELSEDPRTVAKFDGPGAAPHHAHSDDAGFDLAYHGQGTITIAPGETCNIPSGIRIELPDTLWALVTGRSSAFRNNLLVPVSIIDAGFRGELFAVCKNIGATPIEVRPGDRIAQVIPMPLLAPHLRWERGELSETKRGDRGFGSTGR